MSTNFVLSATWPAPPVDVGALIDRAFPGERVREAARALVMKLLTDGQMTQYEDDRTALYLATDRRPAVQALLDGMPAEDRLRLLNLLDNTVASPTLEGLVLGRWPSRGFLLEAREIFRLPELREHVTASASETLCDKLGAARRILQQRSPGSPVCALLDLLARVERDTPRTAAGGQVRLDEYRVLCRSDPQTLALARGLAKELQDTSIALVRALTGASSSYLPRTAGGTSGEDEQLNVIDRADVADYCAFLCCVAREILEQCRPPTAPDQGSEMTGQAATCVARSVSEAILITFLQRRFPGMSAPADAEVEGSRPQSAEDHQRVRQQLQRKVPLFLQTLSLFESFREAARVLPALFLRGELVRTGPLVGDMLDALGRSVRAWADLRMLADHVEVPRSILPGPAQPWAFLHPLPELAVLRCLEEPRQRQDRSARSFYIAATFCQHLQDTAIASFAGRIIPDKGVGAGIGVHAPDGGACLSAGTCVPVRQFLHPEDPASIVAAFLARQAGRDVREIMKLLEVFEVEQQVREAARDVPRLDFLHCKRAVRGRLLFWRKRVEHFVYLVIRRQDAVRLGVLARVRALPPREQTLLREHFGVCPEDPVALRVEATDDRDDDGGQEPPKPPAPAPEQREEPEGAPTGDKVGVG
jgi:hypothetical protein